MMDLLTWDDLTVEEIDEALDRVRTTLQRRLSVHQREYVEDYRDRLLDRRILLTAANASAHQHR